MVFSSPAFLFIFLPLALLCSWWAGVRLQNWLLIFISLGFYYYGGGALVLLLLGVCLVNWALALWLERGPREKWRIASGITVNVGLLLYYKYANFAVAQFSSFMGKEVAGWQEVVLPIGISFFTFQGISYLLDVWRGEARAFRWPQDILLCITFFPHLIAGPIVRLSHLADQLQHRVRSADDFATGAARFIWGLGKKVLIADVCGRVADAAFAGELDRLCPEAAWLAVLAYTLQIYFDFSGYSDMAIGLARMWSFRFPENFLHPYTAVSMTDFWRRWHMSLSLWFRDYLYIPLGGNRAHPVRVYGNLLVVFLITGLWHGAAWVFLLWGLYHGVFLLLERVTGVAAWPIERWHWLRRVLTLLIVMGSWVLFRSPDLASAQQVLSALLGAGTRWPVALAVRQLMDVQTLLALLLGSFAFFSPRAFTVGQFIEQQHDTKAAWLRTALIVLGLPLCLIQVLASDYSPFLYFQF